MENVLNNTVKLSLTTSQNNEEIVTLDNVKASDAYLTWGTTRGDSKVTLWEADATYDVSEANAIDPAKMINFSAIGTSFKNIINAAKDIDVTGNNTKSTTKAAAKTVLKETAQAVANLVNAKIPALPALALKAEWTDNTVGTRNVISDYSLAATAYQPLSFAFGDIEGEALPNISLNKIDNAVAKIVTKIYKELNSLNSKLNINIGDIDLSEVKLTYNKEVKMYYHLKEVDTGTYAVDKIQLDGEAPTDVQPADAAQQNDKWYDGGTVTINPDFSDAIEDLQKAINNGIDLIYSILSFK